MVELSGAGGSVQTLEMHVGGCLSAACSAETLGLTQVQAKQLLAELQPLILASCILTIGHLKRSHAVFSRKIAGDTFG
jgi:hypothetical protein